MATGIHLPVIQERSPRTHTGVQCVTPKCNAHKSPTLCAQIHHFVSTNPPLCGCYLKGTSMRLSWVLAFTLTGDQYAAPDSRPLHLGEVPIPNFATLAKNLCFSAKLPLCVKNLLPARPHLVSVILSQSSRDAEEQRFVVTCIDPIDACADIFRQNRISAEK